MRAVGFGLSHVGRVRQRNEDSIHIDSTGRFALLADGMGGHLGGQEASRMCIALLTKTLEDAFESGFPTEEADVRALLRGAFRQAAIEVAERGAADAALAQMGTTLVAWVNGGDHVHVAHVGDSRCYLLRDDAFFQVTMDHVLEQEQIRMGLPREQAERLPLRHVLTRNIGVVPPSEPDILRSESRVGDLWLLCSDGLSNKLSHTDIGHVLGRFVRESPRAARELVEEAWHRGGEDNISVVLLEVHEQVSKKTDANTSSEPDTPPQ